MYNVSIYGGAGDGGDNEDGAKVDYIVRLLDPELDGKGYVVVTDNYYSSERLAMTLNKRGIGFVGTYNVNMTSFTGFERPENGTYQSGAKQGETRYGPALEPGKYRTATGRLPTIDENAGQELPSTSRASRVKPLSDRLFITSWLDSSKTNAVNIIGNFCEAEHAKVLRQPRAPTDNNPECAREERDCPWLAELYNKYYGGVDTADMAADLTRFDHKSSIPERCRS